MTATEGPPGQALVTEDIHPLSKAIELVGLVNLARELQVTHQAIRKWQANGRMPRTEWTEETEYCTCIARLTGGQITKAMLLAPWPKWHPRRRAQSVEGAVAP